MATCTLRSQIHKALRHEFNCWAVGTIALWFVKNEQFLVAIHAGSSNPDIAWCICIRYHCETVNFMLNKRKSKKAAGAVPQTPLGELSALPQTPLLSREGTPPPVPSPVVNIFIRPPPPPPFPKILDPPLHVTSCLCSCLNIHCD